MILGRSPNLVFGAFVAIFNVIVLVAANQGATFFTPDIVAGINVAAGAVIALIANTNSIQIAAGNAAAARQSK